MVPEQYAKLGRKLFTDRRDGAMVIAVLVASVTYTAGMSPPGGLWQDDLNGHTAGTSILRDKFPGRYTTFSYANGTAFITSLVLIVLLMNEHASDHWHRIKMMYILMLLSLVSLIIAYVAGSERRLNNSFYVIGLALAFLVYVLGDYFTIPISKNIQRKFFSNADEKQPEQEVNLENTRFTPEKQPEQEVNLENTRFTPEKQPEQEVNLENTRFTPEKQLEQEVNLEPSKQKEVMDLEYNYPQYTPEKHRKKEVNHEYPRSESLDHMIPQLDDIILC